MPELTRNIKFSAFITSFLIYFYVIALYYIKKTDILYGSRIDTNSKY